MTFFGYEQIIVRNFTTYCSLRYWMVSDPRTILMGLVQEVRILFDMDKRPVYVNDY
jgi:hypothetical protein